MIGALVVLFCLLLSCTANDCPVCPKNPLPCHSTVRYGDPCPCKTCLTKCSVRKPVCGAGEVCTYEPVYYGNDLLGASAVCKPFVSCPQIQCPQGCPESGYYVDLNGCTTCLCENPCKELKCTGECGASSIHPGEEPNYKCFD